MLTTLILLVLGYVVGSISAAILTCKALRLPDPRSTGSNNPGATNVLRLGGKKAAFITLFGDMLKGLLPVLLAASITDSSTAIAAAGLGAFLGHLYPVFFGFQGGKGVATALGVLLGFSGMGGLLAILTWLAVSLTSRYSSLASLVTFFAAPFYIWILTGQLPLTASLVVMSGMLFWRHRENIERLRNGTESKIGEKKKA